MPCKKKSARPLPPLADAQQQSELPLARLKKAAKGKPRVFDWAIGWLTREDKIVITQEKRTFPLRARKDEGKGGKTSAFVR
jgi:hypothetical protein